MSSIEDRLENVCQKINSTGFYVSLYAQNDFKDIANASEAIQHEVWFKGYDKFMHSPFEAVNPHKDIVVLYKVDAGLFNAFPVHCNANALQKFFMPSCMHDSLSGAVIVSHKLKMLSFLRACYDPDGNEDIFSLWFNYDKLVEWDSAFGIRNDTSPIPIFHPNLMYASYNDAFGFWKISSIVPWAICLSIDDHWNNELLLSKAYMHNAISRFKKDISTAYSIIAAQKQNIAVLNTMIDDCQQDFEKYKTDIYACRVESELRNVNSITT